MYVNPFWMGVLVTIVVEIVGILIASTVTAIKERNDERH